MTFSKKGIEKLHYGALTFGFEGYIPVVENRLVMIPQLYGSCLFGKGAVNGTANGLTCIISSTKRRHLCGAKCTTIMLRTGGEPDCDILLTQRSLL